MAIEVRRETEAVPIGASAAARLTGDEVWHELAKSSFAVIGYVTPTGEPRSSGVVFTSVDRRLYTLVAPDSWKAKHIAASRRVSVTVPVRRGGILALLLPIPPACISFHATAIVHPPGSVDVASLSKDLTSMVPKERLTRGCIIELVPEGDFLTFGVGVSLTDMLHPDVATARVPVT
jgi:hypothetical protein